MKKISLITIITWLISFYTIAGNIYYVSTNGDNQSIGSLKKPFKTIQKAADIMRAGDICYIMQGVYRESINLKYDGDSMHPIRFENFKKDTVVITNTDLLSKWEKYKGQIYKSYCKKPVSQVFHNQIESPLASFPNISDKLNANDWAPAKIDSAGIVVFKNDKFSENYWKGAFCRILTGKEWIAHIGKVVSSSDSVAFCENSEAPFENKDKKVYLGKGRVCMLGHMNALDSENEWIWSNDTLYYFIPTNINVESFAVEARTNQNGVNAIGRKFINISGLRLFAASLNFKDAQNCIIENGSVQYPNTFQWYGTGWTREINYKIDSLATDKWPAKGVYISGKNNIIRSVYVAHCWGDGISLGGSYNTIYNCLIEDCNWSLTDCAAISATGKNLSILNSTCHTTGRSVIVHRFADKIAIKYNHLYNGGLGTDDLGMTYTYKTNGDGAEIAYNWIHDNKAPGNPSGIYLDNNDTSFIVHHNVIWNCKYGIQTNKNAINHEIYNNTIFNCENPTWAWGPEGSVLKGQKVYNNLSENPVLVGNDLINNIIDSKLCLKNESQFDFRLKKNSKAINAGIKIKNITNKHSNNTPNVGAYETSNDKWIAGSNVKTVKYIYPVKNR